MTCTYNKKNQHLIDTKFNDKFQILISVKTINFFMNTHKTPFYFTHFRKTLLRNIDLKTSNEGKTLFYIMSSCLLRLTVNSEIFISTHFMLQDSYCRLLTNF